MSKMNLEGYTKCATAVAATAGCLTPSTVEAVVTKWDVNQVIGAGPLSISATFNTAFRIDFDDSGDIYFWGPNNNLDFIDKGGNDPARWYSGESINAAGLASVTSAGGITTHSWFNAVSVPNTNHDIQYQWTSGTTGFMGIRFDAGASNFHYGWVEMTADLSGNISVDSWALSDTVGETAITGVAIPEGDTLSMDLLVFGAAGLVELRRRKKAKSVA